MRVHALLHPLLPAPHLTWRRAAAAARQGALAIRRRLLGCGTRGESSASRSVLLGERHPTTLQLMQHRQQRSAAASVPINALTHGCLAAEPITSPRAAPVSLSLCPASRPTRLGLNLLCQLHVSGVIKLSGAAGALRRGGRLDEGVAGCGGV